MRVSPIYVLLAVALGALAAAGWFVITATAPQPSGGVASARVLSPRLRAPGADATPSASPRLPAR